MIVARPSIWQIQPCGAESALGAASIGCIGVNNSPFRLSASYLVAFAEASGETI
jgi:hypothetical protein